MMLDKADRIQKNYWKNYISYGDYYLKNEKPQDAEEYFKKALALNPTERLVYVTLADYYRSINDYDDAISLLESGEKLFNNFYSGIILLADCYLSKAKETGKGYDKAIEKYLWIKENGPQKDNQFLSGLYYKMGYSYETIDPDKAVDCYMESLRYEPANEFVRNSFEYFALNNFRVDSQVRKDLSLFHLSSSDESYKRGDDDSYFFHLKRAATLYPLYAEPREKLVEYYESRNDYYDSYHELQSLVKVDQSYMVRDKLENYEWRITNHTLKLEEPEYYPYRGLVLIRSDYFNFSKVYSDAILYNSVYYGKFKFSTMDYRKEEGINTVLEYLRENNYSFFITGELDKALSYLQFKLYDKNGKLIDSLSLNYKMEEMNTSVNRFLVWLDRLLPSIWVTGDESSPGVYYLSAGSMNGIKTNDYLGAFDVGHGDFRRLSVLKIMKLRDYSSDIQVITNYKDWNYETLTGKYVMKNEYFIPKYLTNLKKILGY
jgi:tetratricopeptide (TPR) repeat protein